jgi:hypothetical protein
MKNSMKLTTRNIKLLQAKKVFKAVTRSKIGKTLGTHTRQRLFLQQNSYHFSP